MAWEITSWIRPASNSQRSTCLCLLNDVIQGVYHHIRLPFISVTPGRFSTLFLISCSVTLLYIQLVVCFCLYFGFSRQGLSVSPWLFWSSLNTRLAWSSQRSAWLCLPSAGIKGTHHCHPARNVDLQTGKNQQNTKQNQTKKQEVMETVWPSTN